MTRVVMEATSDYWRAPFYVLEAAGFETWLVNAKDVKHLPGRPKTDVLDSVWLCKVAERQMLRPSFVPPRDIRELRDLTRYRIDQVGVRTAEKQRVEKLLEDAGIKLDVVASDIFGVSGRAMLAALIAGQRDPEGAGRDGPRPDAGQATPAGRGADRAVHRPPRLPAGQDAGPDRRARRRHRRPGRPGSRRSSPLSPRGGALVEIPGIGPTAAAVIIAEIGVDMTRFPTAAHLAGWAKFAPGIKESAGRKKGTGATGHGNRYLARVLGEAAVSAGETDTFLGERYRRIARRRGKKKAIVAVGRSILVIIWHLLVRTRHPLPRPRTRLLRHPARRPARHTQPHPRTRRPSATHVTLEPAA